MVLPGSKSSSVQGPYYNKGIGDSYSNCSTTHIATITLLYTLYTERNWPWEKSPLPTNISGIIVPKSYPLSPLCFMSDSYRRQVESCISRFQHLFIPMPIISAWSYFTASVLGNYQHIICDFVEIFFLHFTHLDTPPGYCILPSLFHLSQTPLPVISSTLPSYPHSTFPC